MKTIQLNLYGFKELDEKAKEKALEHFRDTNTYHEWWDFVYDDFITITADLGVYVEKHTIGFSGFYSQGDGCGFSATVDRKTLLDGIASKAWQAYMSNHELDLSPPAIDGRVLKLVVNKVIELEPRIIKRNRCYAVIADLGGYPAEETKNHDLVYGEIDNLEKWLEAVAVVLNRFLYQSLQDEYEYLTSYATVADAVEANAYLFTADGKFANHLDKLARMTH